MDYFYELTPGLTYKKLHSPVTILAICHRVLAIDVMCVQPEPKYLPCCLFSYHTTQFFFLYSQLLCGGAKENNQKVATSWMKVWETRGIGPCIGCKDRITKTWKVQEHPERIITL